MIPPFGAAARYCPFPLEVMSDQSRVGASVATHVRLYSTDGAYVALGAMVTGATEGMTDGTKLVGVRVGAKFG